MQIKKSDILICTNGFASAALTFWDIQNPWIKFCFFIILGITIVSYGNTLKKELSEKKAEK